jgi:hypothetical protein
MKLREIQQETMIFELRREVGNVLSESIVEYLATVLGHLKSKEQHDLFNTENPLIKVDQLASVIAGLKVLSDHEIRSTLTVDDVRINPNSSIQMFNLLNSVPKNGKGTPKLTIDVFKALAKIAPRHFAEERVRMKALKSKNESERTKAIAELEKMFNKVRSIAHGEDEE